MGAQEDNRTTIRRSLSGDLLEPRQPRQEFTVTELAREAGTTVRNLRAYQDRGLLPPPQKRGRTGIYTDVHLARLRIIGQLLERGFNLGNIKDLLTAWEEGRELNDVLGLELILTGPWSDEAPGYITWDELYEAFGEQLTTRAMEKAVSLGYLVPEGDRLRVPSPRILNAGIELAAGGIPLEALLEEANSVRANVTLVAEGFVRLVEEQVIDPRFGEGRLPRPEDVPELADFVQRVRPLAQMVVSSELSRALETTIQRVLVDRLENVFEGLEAPGATRDMRDAAGADGHAGDGDGSDD